MSFDHSLSALEAVFANGGLRAQILGFADLKLEHAYLYVAPVCQAWWLAHLKAVCWSAPNDLLFKDRAFYSKATKAYGSTLARTAVTSVSCYEYAQRAGIGNEMLAYAVGCCGADDMFALYGDSSLACMKGAAAAGHLDRLQTKQNECVGRDQQFYDEILWRAAEAGRIAVLEHVIGLRDVHFERDSLK